MDHFQKLKKQIQQHVLMVMLGTNLLLIGFGLVLVNYLHVNTYITGVIAAVLVVIISFAYSKYLTNYVTEPLQTLRQAILHVAPEHQGTPAPNLEKTKVGRELVTTLALEVYQLASTLENKNITTKQETKTVSDQSEAVVNNLPIPVVVLDREQIIVFANKAISEYIGLPINEIIGKNMYSILDLSFASDQTFDTWLAACRKDKLTATGTWERVRVETPQKQRKQFDMVAYYNKNNPNNVETIVGLFDQTTKYSQDDDAMGFVALAVHELRTPLTMIRGYIEVLDKELAGKLDPELTGYVKKMQAAAQQLANFVTNILNVARVEEDQLFLQLKEEKWENVLRSTLETLNLRAQVHGKQIVLQLQSNLPTVAIDRITISEVIINLIDNAIKYSNKSNRIVVRSFVGNNGMVETTVQDFGIGIPANIIGNLFEKFYRNHRSRAQVGGTGLGLYLSKSIVTAHGGQIWVQSKENEGSTFGFSLVPYTQLAAELKKSDNKEDITRIAHGWIKNHSFYRR